MTENEKPKSVPGSLPDPADFDPATAPSKPSRMRDITKEVVAQRGGIQIIGGVRPPPAKPEAAP